MGRKSKSRSFVVEGKDGPPCPRCSMPTQIRKHEAVTERHLRQPFYYSEWHVCTNPECKTTLIMPDDKKVFRNVEDGDRSYASRLIEAQLEYAMTGKMDDEFIDVADLRAPWED